MQHNHHLERAIRYLLPQQHNSRESVIAELGDQSDTRVTQSPQKSQERVATLCRGA